MNTREFHNLITIGTVAEIQDDGKKARVKIGEQITPFLDLPAIYGENFHIWAPVKETAQVILGAPSGNLDAAKIIGFLWPQGGAPYSSDRKIDGIKFADGTLVEYNSKDKRLKVLCAGDVVISAAENMTIEAGKNLSLKAAETLSIEADKIKLSGPVTQTGGDMTSDGVSVQNHKHIETSTVTKAPIK